MNRHSGHQGRSTALPGGAPARRWLPARTSPQRINNKDVSAGNEKSTFHTENTVSEGCGDAGVQAAQAPQL